jgi:hypothetical protein
LNCIQHGLIIHRFSKITGRSGLFGLLPDLIRINGGEEDIFIIVFSILYRALILAQPISLYGQFIGTVKIFIRAIPMPTWFNFITLWYFY